MNILARHLMIPDAARYAMVLLIASENLGRFTGTKASLLDMVGELPEREELVLALHYRDGLSSAEVSKLLNAGKSETITSRRQDSAMLQTVSQAGF